jgi:hypothetical protein
MVIEYDTEGNGGSGSGGALPGKLCPRAGHQAPQWGHQGYGGIAPFTGLFWPALAVDCYRLTACVGRMTAANN